MLDFLFDLPLLLVGPGIIFMLCVFALAGLGVVRRSLRRSRFAARRLPTHLRSVDEAVNPGAMKNAVALVGLAGGLLSSCRSTGPGTVQRGRMHYSTAS